MSIIIGMVWETSVLLAQIYFVPRREKMQLLFFPHFIKNTYFNQKMQKKEKVK